MARRREGGARAEFWREVLAKHESSGLSVRGFCQRESISEPSFYWWRRQWTQGKRAVGQQDRGRSTRAAATSSNRSVPTRFVNVSLISDAAMIELELPNGRRLRIPPGCDESTLATVLRVLESPSC